MKTPFNFRDSSGHLVALALALGIVLPLPSSAASLTLATSPLATASTAVVDPNIMFMLDDSGSMAWDYMPDNALNFSGYYGFESSHCNGVYYDPTFTYTPPYTSTGTSYPNSSFTAAWNNGYSTGSGTTNLNTSYPGGSGSGNSGAPNYSGPAFYYQYSGTQTSPYQMNYQATSSIFYKECISPVGSTTMVDGTHPVNTVFTQINLATTPTSIITVIPPPGATITVSGNSTTKVSTVIVNGMELISGTTSSSSNSSTLASYIAAAINGCTTTKTGNCTTTGGTGVSAVVSGSVVTLYGNGTLGGKTPAVTNASGTMSYTYTAFPTINPTYVSGITVNGVGISTSTATTQSAATLAAAIASAINSPRSATVSGNVVTVTGLTADSLYTPVINTVTTGTGTGLTMTATSFPDSTPAHLQNFANWYSYYSNRMLMMKTGVGQAFSAIGSNYRVGFMTMNNNVAPDIVDIAPFTDVTDPVTGATNQKSNWYTKLYASSPGNSTPLREALSHIGQLYAHKIGNYTTYTATITVNGSASTVVNNIDVNGVSIVNGATAPSASASTVASNIALQINIPVVSNYGASVSGNVVTITSACGGSNMPATCVASDVGLAPVESDDGGGMTFIITPFVANPHTSNLNGITPRDPIQFSCQQNFVILSTDGYWNGSTTYDLNNNPVGNQDGTAPRPMYDGASFTKTTSQVFQSQTQMTQTTTQMQSSTTQVQKSTSSLQSQTTQLQSQTSQLQKQVSQLQKQTSQLQKQTTQLQATQAYFYKCKSGGGQCQSISFDCTVSGTNDSNRPLCSTNGTLTTVGVPSCSVGSTSNPATLACNSVVTTAYANASSCTATTTPNSSGYTTQCQTVVSSPFANASSCTATTTPNSSGQTTQCQTVVSSAWAGVSSCTATTTPNSSGQTTQCQTVVSSAWAGAPSCTATTTPNSSGYTTQCQSVVTSPYANASSCTASATPDSSGITTQCKYTSWTAYANSASSCAPLAQSPGPSYTVGTAVQCQTLCNGTALSGYPGSCTAYVGASSCTTTNSPGTGLTVTCPSPNPVTIGPANTPVASCTAQTAGSSNSWTTISCTPNNIQNSTAVASCTPVSASAGNNYVATTCTNTTLSTSNNASSCTAGNTGPPNYIQTTCTLGSGGTSNTLADVAMYYYQTDLRDQSLGNCNGAASSTYPSGNTDVCSNNVFVTTQDSNVQQHLTTYTLGIGTRGAMVYTSPNYMTDTSGDFYSVLTGAAASSSATPNPICSWQTNGTTCNWPVPSSNSYTNVDDLWHAAVNGRGTYYQATNPIALANGLSGALANITARTGSAAAAATSTLNPVPGNNLAYIASYTTVQWTGNLEARTINTNTAVVSSTDTWCAENVAAATCLSPSTVVATNSGNSTTYNCVTPVPTAANCAAPGVFDPVALTCAVPMNNSCSGTLPPTITSASSDSRHILTAGTSSTGLVNFDATYAAANSANLVGNISNLSQWAGLNTTQQGLAATPANLVNYLRGQFQYDNRASNPVASQLYRSRLAVMGDALESQPSFIAAPTFAYADTGYSAFVAANASRPGAVYIGTNDGMLHAFNGATGTENWAFVPSAVIPNLYKLADFNYGTQHVNYVNGSPIISDFYCTSNCVGGVTPSWRTILVGGLNAGGREYYAIDITNPTSPALLWEFTPAQDANLGYTYGNPIVTKMANGTWVVLVTSGYDNGSLSGDGSTANSPAGNGQGYLYVLDVQSGTIISKIGTGVGTAGTPSGLGKIAAWNSAATTNQASYIYGGDLLGNLWRFDINADTAFLVAQLDGPTGLAQPITTTPTLGQIDSERVVFVGTGSYLQSADLNNASVQSLYAISDTSTSTLYNPRSITKTTGSSATGEMVQQTITPPPYNSNTTRTSTDNPVDFTVDRGWYTDFPDTGERENIDSQLVQGTLIVPTIVPGNTACQPGGYGWLNFFDYTTGGPVAIQLTPNGAINTNVSVQYMSPIVGVTVLWINSAPNIGVSTTANGTPVMNPLVPIQPAVTNFSGTRASWRELIP